MDQDAKILIVDDEPFFADFVAKALEKSGHGCHRASNGAEAMEKLGPGPECPYDLIISDVRMPIMGGKELLQKAKERFPHLIVIIMTTHATADAIIEATQSGAFDYLMKPFKTEELQDIVVKALSTSRLVGKPIEIANDFRSDKDAVVGLGHGMLELFKNIGRVASKPIPVLIQGETGTGKELTARAVFQHSERSNKPFVAVNCAAIPESLIESELFGHVKGAFTGAHSDRVGRFEQAHGGTLFLDEIGDIALKTQATLLRALQEKVITRVGSSKEIHVDARIISATHKDLHELVKAGEFRDDLLYRINAATLRVPPLRERTEDIPKLAEYFLLKYSQEFKMEPPSITEDAIEHLGHQPWPGNIRQLENVIKQALADNQGEVLGWDSIIRFLDPVQPQPSLKSEDPLSIRSLVSQGIEKLDAKQEGDLWAELVERLESEVYQEAYRKAEGNLSLLSRWLGVSRVTVRDKVRRYCTEE